MSKKTITLQTKPTATAVKDDGTLRIGGMSPLFPPIAIADDGKLRIGGMSPLFAAEIADDGKLLIGGMSPMFPAR